MSALSLRPVARRHQLIRSSIRRYATESPAEAAKSTAQSAGSSVSSAASNATASAKSTAQSAGSSVQSAASNATASAQQTAQNVAAKATELLNKGIAAAGPMAAKLGESATNLANRAPAGGKGIVGAVQGMIPSTVYYSKVVGEVGKQIYRQQQMSPPSLEAFQKFWTPYYTPLLNPSGYLQLIRNVSARVQNIPEPQKIMQEVQSISAKDWAQYGIWAAECLGFFTVGQMIGRRKIVGYRGGVQEHH